MDLVVAQIQKAEDILCWEEAEVGLRDVVAIEEHGHDGAAAAARGTGDGRQVRVLAHLHITPPCTVRGREHSIVC